MRRVAFAALLTCGFLAAPVAAVTTTTTITLDGTISSGRDPMGTFTLWGTNLAGKSFSASYTFISDLSSSAGQAAGVDLLDIAKGSTSSSFSLTINGFTFSAAANAAGMVRSVDGLGGLASGGQDELQVGATNTSAGKTFVMSATIKSALHNMLSDTRSVNAVPSFTYLTQASDNATGAFSYSQSPGLPDVLTSGSLAINKIVVASTPELPNVSPVPEPGEWAMIVAGFGVVGAAARRRRA